MDSLDRTKAGQPPAKPTISASLRPIYILAVAIGVGVAISVPGLLFGGSAALAAALLMALAFVAAPTVRRAPWRSEAAVFEPFAEPGAVAVHDGRIFDALVAHELGRARRYERPLAYVSISIADGRSGDRDAVVGLLGRALRASDLLGSDGDGRVHVVLPETSGDAARLLLPRFCAALPAPVASRLRVGVASFPDDEVTWVGLKERAVALEQPLEERDDIDDTHPGPPSGVVRLHTRPRRRRRRSSVGTVRRAVDVLVVLLVAPLVLPLFGILALAIRLETRGPTLVRHERLGRAGGRVVLLKLRTMVADADRLKEDLSHLNVLTWPDFKIPNDPRVTRVGRFLRKTSLDELPQLWNLVRGDITLVGPRPCSVDIDHYALWQTERLEVMPGLFGRWQARGRAAVTFDERCRMDIGEIKTRSLGSELRVTFETLLAVVTGRGAA